MISGILFATEEPPEMIVTAFLISRWETFAVNSQEASAVSSAVSSASVGASVGAFVGAFAVGDVGALVGAFVGAFVVGDVGALVVGACVATRAQSAIVSE